MRLEPLRLVAGSLHPGPAVVVRVDPVISGALDGLRVQTSLLGRPIDVSYRIRAAGCGVNEIVLNDRPVNFQRDTNPHRPGAALIAVATLLERLAAEHNVLKIHMG